jgi:hypothetical protein
LTTGGLDGLFACYRGITDKVQAADAFGADDAVGYNELNRPYSLYTVVSGRILWRSHERCLETP